jgi:hypothetical protein
MTAYFIIGAAVAGLSLLRRTQRIRNKDDLAITLITLVAITIAWPAAVLVAALAKVEEEPRWEGKQRPSDKTD